MKPKIFLPFLLSLYILNSTLYIDAQATVRYVSPTGSSTPPYTTWETAADSIMECINISVFGDTIYVANGTYKEQVVMIPGLSLIGAGMDSCVIDTRELVQPSDFFSIRMVDTCFVKGFQIIVAPDDYNHGTGFLHMGLSGKFEENQVINGAIGALVLNSNIIVSQNIFKTNLLTSIEILGYGTQYIPIIENNNIYTSAYAILINFGTKPTIRNNIIYLDGNFAFGYRGGGSDTARIYSNLIISKNSVDGFLNTGVPHLTYNNFAFGKIDNAIVFTGDNSYLIQLVNNSIMNADKGIVSEGGQGITAHFNNAWNTVVNYSGFTPDSTNLSVDPMIVNDDSTKGDLDFHLQMFSPLIDAGDPNIIDVDGTRSDIGLYGGPYGEQYHYLDLAPRTPINLNATLDSLTVGLTWNKNTEADFRDYNIYRDTTKDFMIDSTKLLLSQNDTTFTDIIPDYVPKIYYKITAVDNQGNESEPSEEVGFILTSINDNQMTINDYRLYQNYPNPFNPLTKISYRLKERGYVKLYVYDIKGELVSVLVNQTQDAGFYEVDFVGNGLPTVPNNSDLSSGIYIYQIMVRNENNIPVFSDMKKMIYLK